MSQLDDAKKMAAFTPYFERDGQAVCWWCREMVKPNADYHSATCPSQSWPKIVAALEAAEQATAIMAAWPSGYDEYGVWSDWTDTAKPRIEALASAIGDGED